MDFRVGILTVSDRTYAGIYPDAAGPQLEAHIAASGGLVEKRAVVPDDAKEISRTLRDWADMDRLDLILTTGGTGLGHRDVTPEATLEIIDRLVPGIPEEIRRRSLEVTQHAMISRSVAGVRGSTLIINLPGSPKGAIESLEVVLPVLPHAIKLLRHDPDAEAGHQRG
ncbi:MAG TPA: MogA/MoaB family molybdenum cofactor biosynthesis protein [Anaerolineales bacterium]|nr:MogA/MoaB family molybdenum cofactor biosynthesis protein [Anaerolineales bacterium]